MLGALSPTEVKFIADGVAQNVRTDGRGRFEFRPYHLETGLISQTSGSSKFIIDKTHVVVGVKASLTEPLQSSPDCGIVRVAVDCCPSASPEFDGRGAQDLNIKLSQALEALLVSGDHINLRDLCLIPKRQCWLLNVDAIVLDSGGNLFDAISIAIRAALANTTIPHVKVIETGKVGEYDLEMPDDPDDVISISVDKVPIYVTFANIGNFAVMDPSLEEEMCRGCRLTVGVNKAGSVCGMDKGTGSFSLDSLPELTLAATKVGAKIIEDIDAKLLAEKEGKTHKFGFSKPSPIV